MTNYPAALPGSLQVFTLKQGGVNLTIGDTVPECEVIRCVEEGSISATWPDGTSDTINMVAGDVYNAMYIDTISISEGIFHVS